MLPLGLAMIWQGELPVPEFEVRAPEAAEVSFQMPPPVRPATGETALAATTGEGPALSTGTGGVERSGQSRRSGQPAGSSNVVEKAAGTASSSKGKKGKKSCLGDNPAIDVGANGVVRIDRELVSSYAKKPATLGELGWVERHTNAHGKADGFRVGGIRCGNDLHEAGLRNGDVVHSVNGKPLTSVAEALWAYATVNRNQRLQLRITRKGQTHTLLYKLA